MHLCVGDEVADGDDSAKNQSNIDSNHGGKTEPLAEEQLPAVNGLGGNGVNRGGRDFPGDGVDAGEHSHQDGQHIDGIETNLQDGTENLGANQRGNPGEMDVFYLEVNARGEEGQKRRGGEKRGPENLSASRFAKGDVRDDPELVHWPGSSPMILKNDSSSERRWGVNSKTSTFEEIR